MNRARGNLFFMRSNAMQFFPVVTRGEIEAPASKERWQLVGRVKAKEREKTKEISQVREVGSRRNGSKKMRFRSSRAAAGFAANGCF